MFRHCIIKQYTAISYAAYSAAALSAVPTAPAASPHTALSLHDAFVQRETATRLLLRRSPELVCRNLMCEKVGGPCVCRLALSLSRMPHLTALDLSHNSLTRLPDAVWGAGAEYAPARAAAADVDAGGEELSEDTPGSRCARRGLGLHTLVLRGNRIQSIDASAAQGQAAATLSVLDLRDNAIATAHAFSGWLPKMLALRRVLLRGNPICKAPAEIAGAHAMLPVATFDVHNDEDIFV